MPGTQGAAAVGEGFCPQGHGLLDVTGYCGTCDMVYLTVPRGGAAGIPQTPLTEGRTELEADPKRLERMAAWPGNRKGDDR